MRLNVVFDVQKRPPWLLEQGAYQGNTHSKSFCIKQDQHVPSSTPTMLVMFLAGAPSKVFFRSTTTPPVQSTVTSHLGVAALNTVRQKEDVTSIESVNLQEQKFTKTTPSA